MFFGPSYRIVELRDWERIVGKEKWRDGHSTKQLAKTWLEAQCLPPAVKAVIVGRYPLGANPRCIRAIVEHRVYLDSMRGPSTSDIFLEVEGAAGRVAIMVEGKVDEPFGPLVYKWLEESTSLQSRSKRDRRLAFLCDLLGLAPDRVMDIRYQLLHRTASAVIQAKRDNIGNAMVLVHSFSLADTGLRDYQEFLRLLGITSADVDLQVGPAYLQGVPCYFAWVKDV